MLSKYSDPTPATPTSPTPKESSKSSDGGQKKEEKVNNVPAWVDSDSDDEGEVRSSHAQSHRYHEPRPQKPSLKDRFKLNIGRSSSSKEAPRPRPIRKNPRERVYNSRLAKEPDWDKLPRVQALYNFKAEMRCDLEFRKGQVIKVITRTDSVDDWWEGQLEDRVGIFPANYVKSMF